MRRSAYIQNVNYVNAKARPNTTFRLSFDDEWWALVVKVRLEGMTLGFPDLITKEEIFSVGSSDDLTRVIGGSDSYLSVSRSGKIRLAELLSPKTSLEIGFYHRDIEKNLYQELESLMVDGEWDSSQDWDGNFHCHCRVTIAIGEYKSHWWMSGQRVKRHFVCTREPDQRFDRTWSLRDKEGWGMGSRWG